MLVKRRLFNSKCCSQMEYCFVSQDVSQSLQLTWVALAQVQAQASLERPLVCLGSKV